MPEAGTASKLYIYVQGAAGAVNLPVCVYNDNGSGKPGTYFVSATTIAISAGQAAGWVYKDITGSLTNGVKYFPAAYMAAYLFYDEDDAFDQGDSAYWSGNLGESPSTTNMSAHYSFYIEYTAAAEGRTTKNTRSNHLGEQIGMGFMMDIN
jgi:hypothetical protein